MKKIIDPIQKKKQNQHVLKLPVSKVLLILISFFLIASSLTLVLYSLEHPRLEIKKSAIDVLVENRVGFDVGTDALHFGIIGLGNSGFRQVEITNERSFEVEITVNFDGEVSKWMSSSETKFLLAPKEKKKLTLTMDVPQDAKFGQYEGEVVYYFVKPKN